MRRGTSKHVPSEKSMEEWINLGYIWNTTELIKLLIIDTRVHFWHEVKMSLLLAPQMAMLLWSVTGQQ